jgi:hypothetical protein
MEVVKQLPVRHRWEFTRRHPYYLQFWQSARELRERPSTDEVNRALQEAASLILAAVNVAENVSPPDPRDEFEMLGADVIGSAWEGGAIAPATIRTLAFILLGVLPKDERAQFGRLLCDSAAYEWSDKAQTNSFLKRLASLPGDIWKSQPDAPIVSFNLQAPQRAITEAVEKLVRRWKQEQGIPETRRRDDKFEEYLAVWDLREGWADGGYDGTREKQFHEIAEQLRAPLPTIQSRYHAAFKILTGHDYKPELWIRLFGPIKLSCVNDPVGNSRLACYRPWRTRNLRPVAETVLLPGRRDADHPKFLEAAGITQSDLSLVDLQIDVQTLIKRGDSDDQIRQELDPHRELPNGYLADVIAELRSSR